MMYDLLKLDHAFETREMLILTLLIVCTGLSLSDLKVKKANCGLGERMYW